MPLDKASPSSLPSGKEPAETAWETLTRLGEEISEGWQSPLSSTELLSEMRRREAETWAEVASLIGQMQPKRYDEAVALLVKLRDLARYQGQEVAFQGQVNHLYAKYSRRPSLVHRLREAGLHQS